MKNDKTKVTMFALIALIIVCGGSFIGVRMLNKGANTEVNLPIITTQATNSTTESATTDFGAGSSTTTTQIVIQEPALVTTTQQNDATTKVNQFTTFANAGTTIAPTKPTTTVSPSTLPASNTDVNPSQDPNEVIQNAAVFSDGFLDYQYDRDGGYFYTNGDPWQRNFGFNKLYDTGAPFIVFYYDTMRCKFRYDNRDWLIQFWKGQYGFVFIGAEIGVYNKPADRTVDHYDCANDEDSLPMSMTFYRKGEELLTRNYAKYWWCTGFVPGKLDKFSDRSELTIRCRITMRDYDMLLAFCNSLKNNGLTLNQDYSVSGLDVFMVW